MKGAKEVEEVVNPMEAVEVLRIEEKAHSDQSMPPLSLILC